MMSPDGTPSTCADEGSLAPSGQAATSSGRDRGSGAIAEHRGRRCRRGRRRRACPAATVRDRVPAGDQSGDQSSRRRRGWPGEHERVRCRRRPATIERQDGARGGPSRAKTEPWTRRATNRRAQKSKPGLADDHARLAGGIRIERVDVAVDGVVRRRSVAGRPERSGHPTPGRRPGGHDDQTGDQQRPRGRGPRSCASDRCARRAAGVVLMSMGSHLSRLDHHRSLPCCRGLHEDLAEVIGHAVRGLLVAASRERSVRSASSVFMPDVLPRDLGTVRASASSAARIRPRARCRRDFAVPSGMPEGRRDGWQWEVEVVVEDDHGPHLRVEPEEAALELVAVGARRRRGARASGASRAAVSSTSTRWRRSRRASSMQARTRSRWSQASKRPGRGAWAGRARPGRGRSAPRPWPVRGPGG